MAMTVRSGRGAVVAEINVTPMADIMIVLLIIFMVATPLLDGPRVPLPRARHASNRPPDEMRIVVRSDGAMSVDDRPLAGPELLAEHVRDRRQEEGDALSVRIEADAGADYATVSRAFDACRSVGVTEIALAARLRVD